MLERLTGLFGFTVLIRPLFFRNLLVLCSINLLKCKHRIGFAARLAGHWSNGHFIAVVLHLGWTYNVELLFVNLYFYIFNQQRFRADKQ